MHSVHRLVVGHGSNIVAVGKMSCGIKWPHYINTNYVLISPVSSLGSKQYKTRESNNDN